MTTTPVIYADDTDASWTFTVTRSDGDDVDWADPTVAIGTGDYEVTGEWLTAAGPSRQIRVPLDGLAATRHSLYLRVPGGTDIKLGTVLVRDRT